jgi:hypothetical protein
MDAVRVGEPRWVAILCGEKAYSAGSWLVQLLLAEESNTVRLLSLSWTTIYQSYTHRGGLGPPDWNNRSSGHGRSSRALGWTRGASLRSPLPSCDVRVRLGLRGRPAPHSISNIDLSVGSNIAHEHRPKSVQGMRSCRTARRSGINIHSAEFSIYRVIHKAYLHT